MKKFLFILSLCLLVAGCSSIQEPTHQSVTKDRVEGIVDIDYDTLVDKLNNDVDFLLYIGRPDCQDCREFDPILQAYLEQHPHQGIYYLNIKTFRDEANQEGASEEKKLFYTNLREELDFSWTPILKHIQSGKTVSEFQYLDEDYYQLSLEQRPARLKEFNQAFIQWFEDVY